MTHGAMLQFSHAWCLLLSFKSSPKFFCRRLLSGATNPTPIYPILQHYLTRSPLPLHIQCSWYRNMESCMARGESAKFWMDVFVMFLATFWNNDCLFWQVLCVSHDYWNAYPPADTPKPLCGWHKSLYSQGLLCTFARLFQTCFFRADP
jgi:hypothetical protein